MYVQRIQPMYIHSWSKDHQLPYRYPEAVQRPTFARLHASLQQPDSVLMEWSEDEQVKYSENVRTT